MKTSAPTIWMVLSLVSLVVLMTVSVNGGGAFATIPAVAFAACSVGYVVAQRRAARAKSLDAAQRDD